ncbi:hypothetical protein [Microbacterium cremeum]|uniref:hypothetical protein n=1 Tax=Microbacterium cremeum TaxID=2782169 RepID=UPI001887D4A9|nr:hypothetical protein [Microbacterium cremeum]
MSNQPVPPLVPPADDDPITGDPLDTTELLGADDSMMDDDDRLLDTDLDADRIDSAAADERAATEGTIGDPSAP